MEDSGGESERQERTYPLFIFFFVENCFQTRKGRQSIIETELKSVAGEEAITRQLDTLNF